MDNINKNKWPIPRLKWISLILIILGLFFTIVGNCDFFNRAISLVIVGIGFVIAFSGSFMLGRIK